MLRWSTAALCPNPPTSGSSTASGDAAATAAAASATPKPPPVGASAGQSGTAAGKARGKSALDAAAEAELQARLKVTQSMSDAEFAENTQILKRLGLRGLRAVVICAVGGAAYLGAARKKRREAAAAAAGDDDVSSVSDAELAAADRAAQEAVALSADGKADGPTARYLREMTEVGWDVEGQEKERLAAQRQRYAGKPPVASKEA